VTDLSAPLAEVTQTILFTPAGGRRGIYGNCLQAAVASALGLDLDAVPHFGSYVRWEPAVRLWLRGRGLDWRIADGIPRGRSITVGTTVRGTGDHAVVGDSGEVAWDPHPTRTGLTVVKRSYVLEERPGPEPSR